MWLSKVRKFRNLFGLPSRAKATMITYIVPQNTENWKRYRGELGFGVQKIAYSDKNCNELAEASFKGYKRKTKKRLSITNYNWGIGRTRAKNANLGLGTACCGAYESDNYRVNSPFGAKYLYLKW